MDAVGMTSATMKVKEKTCSRCKKIKSISEFYLSYRSKDGFGYWCKDCKSKYQSAGKGKEDHDKANRKYRKTKEERKAAHKKYNREWYKRKGRDYSLRFNYGITLKQYDEMLKQQNEVCAICGEVNLDGRKLCVDHDHTTGKVRGLLCDSCNHVLGMGKENVDRLAKAILYLEKHKNNLNERENNVT